MANAKKISDLSRRSTVEVSGDVKLRFLRNGVERSYSINIDSPIDIGDLKKLNKRLLNKQVAIGDIPMKGQASMMFSKKDRILNRKLDLGERKSIFYYVKDLKLKHPKGPSLNNIKEFLESKKEKLKPSSIKTLAAALKSLVIKTLGSEYKLNLEVKYEVDEIFTPFATGYSPGVVRDKTIPLETLNYFFQNAPENFRYIANIFYSTTLRAGELCKIKLSDITCINNEVCSLYVVRKGNSQCDVLAPRDIVEDLKRVFGGKKYLVERSNGGPFTTNLMSVNLRYHGEKLGIPNFTPHRLRHSHITHQFMKHPRRKKAIMMQSNIKTDNVFNNTYLHDQVDISLLPRMDITPDGKRL